ncbi:MAG TPA: EF-P lysine aminoacylase EpmA [Hyphomicrobium sp.]|nr:EF-P lysine aminoacylase EpmA [Hyphomicrobium sp.]
MSTDRPWWNPDIHADRRPALLARGRIKSAMRAWFEAQGFIEVETGILQVSPGNEAHLHAFRTRLIGTDLSGRDLYLHTSPEFACKKLLAAGEEKIFTFAPVFRNRERGALHAPEFTMLEWYRAGAPYAAVMDDCAALLKLASEVADNRFVSWRGITANPRARPEQLSVAEAFVRYTGIDLMATTDSDGNDRDALAAAATAAGIAPHADDDWADIFAKVLTALIEPKLGNGAATLLTRYPASEAPLARSCTDDPRFAERFELYCCGVELANGFGELTDPQTQRARLTAEMERKEERYGERYPIDEDFIAALAHMPPASGCAMGFDRVVMLATGATRIDQVLWTPQARTE